MPPPASEPEPEKVVVPPAFIEPSFNLRAILKRLVAVFLLYLFLSAKKGGTPPSPPSYPFFSLDGLAPVFARPEECNTSGVNCALGHPVPKTSIPL